MNAKDVCVAVLKSTQGMLARYLDDLADADLQVVPVAGANNIAWQLGHLIASETALGRELGAQYPELPPALQPLMMGGSAKTHPDGGRLSKGDYLAWFERVRTATIAAVSKLSDEDLGKPNTNVMKAMAPTLGALVVMLGNHTMMHAGQFTVVRRALNKPVWA